MKILMNERGQGMVEYALIVALVGVLLIATLTAFKDGIKAALDAATAALAGA